MRRSRCLRFARTASAVIAFALWTVAFALPARSAGAGVIAGSAFKDLNRNAALDAGEEPFASMPISLFDANGAYVTAAATDAAGAYRLTGLNDGTYQVRVDTTTWWSMRADWVPTTTGSVYFAQTVSLAGTATAHFGLRPIVRSTTLGSPLSAMTGPSGIRVESYTDAVDAAQVHATLTSGSLLGAQAAQTFVRFGYGSTSSCVTSVAGAPGSYTGFSATVWIDYIGWVDTGAVVLFHEYGHAWSLYNAYIVQQDDTLASYVAARGLTGDARLGSSKAWDPKEMIAEDYRQLFGSTSASLYPQANTDVAAAPAVSGLRTFLRDTFTTAPAGSGGSDPAPTPTPEPAPAVQIAGLGVSPQPVSKTGTIAFTRNVDAKVTVRILTANGALVRALLVDASKTAGSVSVRWDRKNASGQRVKAGTYTASVSAIDGSGQTANATRSFGVT